MRALACLLALALAGCTGSDATKMDDAPVAGTAPVASEPVPSGSNTTPTAPFALDLSGTLWVTPPNGGQRFEASVPFQLNATADVHVTVRVASTISPIPTASVEARLRDAAGTELAQAVFWPPVLQSDEQSLDLAGLPAGMYDLHVTAWGGSDGSSGGDHVDYHITT